MWVRYEAHLNALNLWDGERSRTILAETVLSTVQGHILCNDRHQCRLYWRDCERKNLYVPTYPDVLAAITRMLKPVQGE